MSDTPDSASAPQAFALTPGKRILFLTKDPDLIRQQLAGELDLRMEDVSPEDLLDDINTDTMTPAWVCFRHRPAGGHNTVGIDLIERPMQVGRQYIHCRELREKSS